MLWTFLKTAKDFHSSLWVWGRYRALSVIRLQVPVPIRLPGIPQGIGECPDSVKLLFLS
jgi:hypothetical protein